MDQEERRAWIKEKHAWLTEKRQREQEYLKKRDSDLKTDRAYRVDASHELDMLAMLSERYLITTWGTYCCTRSLR